MVHQSTFSSAETRPSTIPGTLKSPVTDYALSGKAIWKGKGKGFFIALGNIGENMQSFSKSQVKSSFSLAPNSEKVNLLCTLVTEQISIASPWVPHGRADTGLLYEGERRKPPVLSPFGKGLV